MKGLLHLTMLAYSTCSGIPWENTQLRLSGLSDHFHSL
jgi:hypothetical protein